MKKPLHNSGMELSAVAQEAVMTEGESKTYQFKETRELVQLVREAADQIHIKGEAAFLDFRKPGSRWREKETYIFVLDPDGNMLVHPDPELEGKNQRELKDVNGKYIIRGLLEAATSLDAKPEGWYHYQWPVPGELLARWKSSFVHLVKSPSGKRYIVGSGMYNDRMEKVFVEDAVMRAVGEIAKRGKNAFELFRDPKGPFIAKDAYIFVFDTNGIELVNPGFPNLEGRNLLELKDAQGKFINREMLKVIQTSGSGWVNYMWPKPGESISTQKSTYVSKAKIGEQIIAVGCGVYLTDAPKATQYTTTMTAPDLKELVRQAADLLKEQGERAYPEFRKKGSKWFRDDTYVFAFTMDGTRAFHAAEPETEGRNDINLKDSLGRPIVKLIMEAGTSPFGEGWAHYMYPEPGNLFPVWKSSFVKRVTFPSGKQFIVGSGIYNMQMDKAFIEDMVNRAAKLVESQGENVFGQLREKRGPFFFMDTYVFVLSPDGTELVNPALPSLEGRNILHLKDLKGKEVIKEEIAAAMTNGSAWLEVNWYMPGDNRSALKQTYVRKVQHDGKVYIIGSGLFGGEGPAGFRKGNEIQKLAWQSIEKERLTETISRQTIFGEKSTLARFSSQKGNKVARHYHANEEYDVILSGAIQYNFDDRELIARSGEVVVIPSNVPHAITAMEDTEFFTFFAPKREDWFRGEDQYLRK